MRTLFSHRETKKDFAFSKKKRMVLAKIADFVIVPKDATLFTKNLLDVTREDIVKTARART